MTRERIIKPLAIAVLRAVGGLFFSRKYLRGRWFDQYTVGWRWVWRSIWTQRVLGFNRHAPFPVSPFIKLGPVENITFHIDDLNNFQDHGCYFQCFGAKIAIGEGTYIAPNVGIITTNHDPSNPDVHLPGADVVIGRKCWIGMNAVVLPGCHLGDGTVVAAGAVVTKSFPEGRCVLAGVPARVIRRLDTAD